MNVQDEWKVSQLLLIDNLFYLLLAFPAIFMTIFILFRSYFLPVSADPLPSFHGAVDRGDQQAEQDGDDRDDGQQFDQRKRPEGRAEADKG